MKLELKPARSSLIKAYGYDAPSKLLRVQFHSDAVYDYLDVPEPVYVEFNTAPSTGKYFLASIKGRYSQFQVEKPGNPPSKREDKCAFAGPIHTRLLSTQAQMLADGSNFMYTLWACCGKPEKGANTSAGKLYRACQELVIEAGGAYKLGSEYLAAAIKLASERKI